MASAAVDIGRGSTLTAGTSSWSAQLTSISWSGVSRSYEDATHLGTVAGSGKIGGKPFVFADISDPGTIEVEGHYNPDTTPPINAPAETWTIQLLDSGDAAGATIAGSGAMIDFSMGALTNEGKRTFTATIKLSGDITITADT